MKVAFVGRLKHITLNQQKNGQVVSFNICCLCHKVYCLLYALQWFIEIYQWNKIRYFHCSVFSGDYFLLYLMFNFLYKHKIRHS